MMSPDWSDLNVVLSREFIIPTNKDIGAKIQQENGEESLYVTSQIIQGLDHQLIRDALIFAETLLVH